jgi:4-carboxymuconolactone decarboxylase
VPDGPDRLPPIPDGELTAAQRAAVEGVMAGPRGELAANWVPLLRSPELMTRLQLVGEYLRFDSVLDDDLVELVILCVARHWGNDFEWWFHHPIALDKGLTPETVADLGHHRRPTSARPEALALWDLVDELLRTGLVSDPTYAAALAALDEVRLVEALGVVGYYTTLALTMNVARTPAPKGQRLPGPPR